MTATYDPIATTTLGSAASTITFSSIPNTFTDLRVVLVGVLASAGQPWMRFNNDSSALYSETYLTGNGSSASSGRYSTPYDFIFINPTDNWATVSPNMATIDIFSYAGSTNKTCLVNCSGDRNGAGTTNAIVGLWRSTSAINRIDINGGGVNFATGFTATLYGIKSE